MKRFALYIKLYGAYLSNSIKMRLAYREDFLSGFVAGIMQQLIGVLFVATIFVRVPDIKGWTKAEVFFIYGFAQVTLGLFYTFCSNLLDMSEKYVVEGRLDQVLLRPLDSLFQVITERIHWEEFSVVLVGLAVLGYAVGKMRMPIEPWQYLATGALAVSACLVLLGIFVILASLTFWFNDRGGVSSMMLVLQGYSQYPLTIYGQTIRLALTLIIPYGFTAFYPAMHLLGRREYGLYAWMTPAAAAAVMVIGIFSWRRSLQAYESTGS
jgi:ABC-2 type transport system permease protein